MSKSNKVHRGKIKSLDEVELPKLPNNWRWATLNDLAASEPHSITDGPFGSNLKTSHYTETGPRVIRLQNIGDGFFLDGYAHISESHFESLKRHEAVAGDIAIAALGETLPRSCVVPDWVGPAIVKADCPRFRPNLLVVFSEFVNYALNSPDTRRRTSGIIHGVGRPRLNLAEVRGIWLPVAPLKEQYRIVAKIEELISDLDAGVAALKRAQANLKRYRAAVLKAAVEGRLTAEWRTEHPATEPASQLLARILQERRQTWEAAQLAKFAAAGKEPPKNWKEKYVEPTPPDTSGLPELPEGWCWASVQQVGSVQLGRQRSPQHHSGQHMRPYLRVANVFEDRIDTSDVMEMNFTPDEFETYRLGYGDILLNEGQSMELIGRPAIYRDEVPGACFTNTLVRFRVYEGVDTDYALRVFLAYLKNGRFQKIATITVNIAHLGAGRFSEIEFPLPPVEEQAAIIEDVDRHFSLIDAAETEIEHSLLRASLLRQSILKQAFEGKLVPQDPNDEPASVLLERLRASAAKLPVEPRTRTRRSSSKKSPRKDRS